MGTTELKDGLGNEFTYLTKDVSAAQDNSLRASRSYASLYPPEYGFGGCYQMTAKSGVMAAGLAGNSPIFSFRWTLADRVAVLRRLRLSAWSLGTGFTAGLALFDLYVARTFTIADTGGASVLPTLNNAKLKTSMAAVGIGDLRCATTATLTAGTRALDAAPINTLAATIGAAQNTAFWPAQQILFERAGSEHPLVLAVSEGFIVQATVPATGTWTFAITPEWDELPTTTTMF